MIEGFIVVACFIGALAIVARSKSRKVVRVRHTFPLLLEVQEDEER